MFEEVYHVRAHEGTLMAIDVITDEKLTMK